MHETLQNGLYVEVLSKDIWNEPLESLQKLVEADNQDQAGGLTDHEMHVIGEISQAMADTVASPITLWESVWAQTSQTNLSTFSKNDCKDFHTLTRTLSVMSK